MTHAEQIAMRRRSTAAALIEYRAFIRANPDDELAPLLAETVASVRARLRSRRGIYRSIGFQNRKVAT